jgi:hypothetical protein
VATRWFQLLPKTLCVVSDFVQEAKFLRISALTTRRGYKVSLSPCRFPRQCHADETEEFQEANRFKYKGSEEEVAS